MAVAKLSVRLTSVSGLWFSGCLPLLTERPGHEYLKEPAGYATELDRLVLNTPSAPNVVFLENGIAIIIYYAVSRLVY